MIDIVELAAGVAQKLGEGWRSEPVPEPWACVVLHGPDDLCILLSERDDQSLRLLWFVPNTIGVGGLVDRELTKEIVAPLQRGTASIAAVINRRLLPYARHILVVARYEQATRDQLLSELAVALGIPAECRGGNEIVFDGGRRDSPSIRIQLRECGQRVDLSMTLPVGKAAAVSHAIGQALAARHQP